MTDIRDVLIERVERKVAGQGISRRAIEGAVARVVDALGSAAPSSQSVSSETIAAFTARSAPDLASRVRKALRAEGVTELQLGIATSGQHTVVTVRAASSASAALERAAKSVGASLSVMPAASVAGGVS